MIMRSSDFSEQCVVTRQIMLICKNIHICLSEDPQQTLCILGHTRNLRNAPVLCELGARSKLLAARVPASAGETIKRPALHVETVRLLCDCRRWDVADWKTSVIQNQTYPEKCTHERPRTVADSYTP
jgi:hypothetical protein